MKTALGARIYQMYHAVTKLGFGRKGEYFMGALSKILSKLLLVAALSFAGTAVLCAQSEDTATVMPPAECRELVSLTSQAVQFAPMARKINSISFIFNDDAQLVAHMTITLQSRNRRVVTDTILPMKEGLVVREGNKLILNTPGRPIIAKRVWWAYPQWVLEKDVSLVRDVDVKQGQSPSVRVNSIGLCLRL